MKKRYEVKRSDGTTVQVSVPLRNCPECDGEGCKACRWSGYEKEEMSEEHEACEDHPCHECLSNMVDAAEARFEGER